MRYELTDYEWAAIKPFLPNKPRGVPRDAFEFASNKPITLIDGQNLLSLLAKHGYQFKIELT
jgi:hypothetical protein